MDPAVAGLIGAGLGSVLGLLGTFLSHWLQGQDEDRKANAALAKDLQLALADFSRKAASGIVSMEWITWIAAEDPLRLSEADFVKYNAEMRSFIPEFTATYSALATLDSEVARRMSLFMRAVFDVDMKIARCEPRFRKSAKTGTEQLASELGEANALFDQLLSLIGRADIGLESRRLHSLRRTGSSGKLDSEN